MKGVVFSSVFLNFKFPDAVIRGGSMKNKSSRSLLFVNDLVSSVISIDDLKLKGNVESSVIH